MLPHISSKSNSEYLLLDLPANGNSSHEGQSTQKSLQPYFTGACEDVEKPSFDKPRHPRETSHSQIQPDRNRKRVRAFAQNPSKARKSSSFKQTTLRVELPSKYEISKSSSHPELQKSCFLGISNSKVPSSAMGYNLPKKKTPQKEVSGRITSTRTSQSHLSQIQSHEKKNPGKNSLTRQTKIGLSVQSQKTTISPASSHISSRAEGYISFSKASSSKNHHVLTHKSLSGSSDSEDPLTSSLSVGKFQFKTRDSSQPHQKLITSPNLSPKFHSVSRPQQKSAHLNSDDSCINRALGSPKSHQQEKPKSIVIDLLSSPDSRKPLQATEPTATAHLRPRKKKIKSLNIKKSRKSNARIHQDVPVPAPIYNPFKCEWEGCRAELMNMEILRKHVYASHGKKLEDGGRRCLWGKCGQIWKNINAEKVTTISSHTNDPVVDSGLIYSKRRDWKEHMEQSHLIPFSWHMGDGPCGSRLAKPSTVWQQSYLFFADGRQTTPSVALQPIEKGAVRKLNAGRFHWQQGGPFGSEILEPIPQLQRPHSLLSHIVAGGVYDNVDEEGTNQQKMNESNQIVEIRNVTTKQQRKDEEEFIPSDF